MAGTPQDTPQETHKDLLALIKASRDLDPDMDQALAESFLEKHTLATQGAQQPVVPQSDPPHPQAVGRFAPAFGMVVIAAVIVAIIVTQTWWAIWLVFPLMGAFGGWRGYGRYHDEHYRMRAERQLAREQWRHDRYLARMGYPPSHPELLPEPAADKWTPPTPPVRQTTPPATPPSSTGPDAPPANPAG